MSTFSYHVFVSVVRYGSFFHASQQLNVTPSAVSHSINQLEEQLGFPLFLRSRSGMTLTSEGSQVLPYIQQLLSDEATLMQISDDIKGLQSGSIKIGAFSSVCINWLPHILGVFSKKYPEIDISIVQGSFEEITQYIKSGELDVGFTTLPVSENLDVIPLLEDPIYCVTPEGFVPKNGQSMTEQDIVNHKFILQKVDYDRDTKLILDYYRVEPNAINFSIDDQSIIAMVEAGIGLGILPKLALQKNPGNIAIFPFEKPASRKIVLVTNKSKAASPSVVELVTEIKHFIEKKYNTKVTLSDEK